MTFHWAWRAALLVLVIVGLAGCGGQAPQTSAPPATDAAGGSSRGSSAATKARGAEAQPAAKRRFKPVELATSAAGNSAAQPRRAAEDKQHDDVVEALQPFQVLLGQWRWVTKRKFGDFPRNGEELKWVWDFQSDPRQPALVCHLPEGPYFETLRLTYLPERQLFRATLVAGQAGTRTFEGTWLEGGEPRDLTETARPQRVYKLLLTQTEPAGGEQWQILLNQLENDQYLFDLKRRAAMASLFTSYDTVRQQRLGTSFALATSDNPGPKCIVSGGLGTQMVTYQGKSYPVCCSGCAAAFNDDPERWLAKRPSAPETGK